MFRTYPYFLIRYRPKLPLVMRENIWNHYVGPSKGETECFCCEQNIITPFRFECAHIVADSKGGNMKLDNFRPCCFHCNRSMGTQNFFVFKSMLHGKIHVDSEKFSEDQKNIVLFYDQIQKNISCRYYLSNFDDWLKITLKNMNYKKKENDHETINKFQCQCKYKFEYVVKENDPEISCRNSKQNLVDVMCDHIPCLINKDNFINGTLETKSYKKWLKEQKD
jgi:hypothetical protein